MDPQHAQSERQSLQRKAGIDWHTTFALVITWLGLIAGSIILLVIGSLDDLNYETYAHSYVVEHDNSNYFLYIIAARATGFSGIPILVAAVFNEALMERCWRRISYFALGEVENEHNTILAENLRAANLRLSTTLWRMITFKLSRRELRAVLSWLLVRVGTAVALASIQMSVSWHTTGSEHRVQGQLHWEWIILPVILHAASIAGSILIWAQSPWIFFSNRFNDEGLLGRYLPYLTRVQGGSLADSHEVADHLVNATSIEKELKTGMQFGAKFSGIWLSILLMFVPSAFFVIWQDYASNYAYAQGPVRFGIQLIFLVQHMFYATALNFIIWNISIDGFTRTKAGTPKHGAKFLGYSAGLVVFIKMITQRRPVRAICFFVLFWLQACVYRLFIIAYAFYTSIGYYEDNARGSDLAFVWIGLFLYTFLITIPWILIWLLVPTSAPISQPNGWTWAQITKDALHGQGYYGAREHEAVWNLNAEPFTEHKGEIMI